MSGPRPAGSRAGGPPARTVAWGLVLLLGFVVLILHVLLRPAGGLRGRYGVGDLGGAVVIHERIDPRIDFPVPQRLDAAYIFHWDIQRHGFPAAMPPYAIRWDGLIHAPVPGRYGFAAEANGEARLSIDGRPVPIDAGTVGEIDLAPGMHPIVLEYALTAGEARLVFRWRPPGGALATVPPAVLAPDAAAPGRARTRRAIGWVMAGVIGAVALLVARRGRKGGGVAGRIVAAVRDERRTLALGAIAILALALRLHDYPLVPFHHETADEYQHAWEGWHLLREGVPASWTTFPDSYPADARREFRWFGDPYIVVRPYFDHPPLFSIPVGLVAALAGANHFLECDLPAIRLVPILLSILGVWLVGRLARQYGASERAALCAALVYATLPVIVMAHRLVKAENLIAILLMGVLVLIEAPERSLRHRRAVWAGVLGGLSIWTKATGVVVPGIAIVLLLARRQRRAALIVGGIAAGFAILYLFYAGAYGWSTFLQVVGGQATSKWVSLEGLQDFLTGRVVSKAFGRGLYLWLWIALAVAAFRKERAILLPVALYTFLLALTADHRVIYGWYRVPIYPFLCIAAGLYLDDMLDEADLPRVFPFAASALVSGLIYAFQAHPFSLPAGGVFRDAVPVSFAQTQIAVVLFALIGCLPYLLRWIREVPWTVRLARATTVALVVIFVLVNVAIVGDLLVIYSGTRGIP